MITEDYCSYEVAKLLKENGFDEGCDKFYPINGGEVEELTLDELNYHRSKFIKAPTHQMAMKWLRDIYSISIEPYCYEYGWYCGFSQLPKGITIYTSQESKEYGTYEESVEAALKYSLENLI